jgi:hypothetical protein
MSDRPSSIHDRNRLVLGGCSVVTIGVLLMYGSAVTGHHPDGGTSVSRE